MKATPIDASAYETITDATALNRWIAAIYDAGAVAVDTETTGLDNQAADLVGISLSVGPGTGAYIPLGHGSADDLLGGGKVDGQMPIREAIDALSGVFMDRSILKIFHNVKYDLGVLNRYGLEVVSHDDTLLLSYSLDGPQFNTMSELEQSLARACGDGDQGSHRDR